MTASPRLPAHAGTFYPARAADLAMLVERQLDEARPAVAAAGIDPDALRGAVVPHAGLAYSGVTAAAGWLAVAAARPTTVVLAGTDHEARSPGAAVWTGGPWRSPLGEVEIDEELAAEMAALGRPFRADDAAHAWEHSLEVQLPFLAALLPETRIAPILVSPYLRRVEEIAGALLGRLLAAKRDAAARIVLVASSDFAHYPPASVAEWVDAQLLVPILALDANGLLRLEARVLEARHEGLACGLCGIDPVRLTLSAVRAMGGTRGILLRHATSADIPGADSRRTVGYAAVALVA